MNFIMSEVVKNNYGKQKYFYFFGSNIERNSMGWRTQWASSSTQGMTFMADDGKIISISLQYADSKEILNLEIGESNRINLNEVRNKEGYILLLTRQNDIFGHKTINNIKLVCRGISSVINRNVKVQEDFFNNLISSIMGILKESYNINAKLIDFLFIENQ